MNRIKTIKAAIATASLAEYAAEIDNGPVIVTSQAKPVTPRVRIENADIESVSLGTNRDFLDLIECSRARA